MFNFKGKAAQIAGIVIASSSLSASAQPLRNENSDLPSLDTGTGLLIKEPINKKAKAPKDEFNELVSLQRTSPSSIKFMEEDKDLLRKALPIFEDDELEKQEDALIAIIERKVLEKQISDLDAKIAKDEKNLKVLKVLGVGTLLLLCREVFKYLCDASREGEAPR